MSTHESHCSYCININCSFKNCLLVKCSHCHIPLHPCKLEEHIEEVCRRAPTKCTNHLNGCPIILIREKIAGHLPNCVASIVVCSRDRCRKLNTKACKLQLKHLGRKNEFLPVDEEDDLDIQLACYDQNLIAGSYHFSRSNRVQQRDSIHPTHPLIPLRNMPYDMTTSPYNLDDSSEDEQREKREKLKKSRMVFANCYMCQIDPSVQHLHTLGNGADIEKLKKRRMTPQVMDQFHEKLNLKVSIVVENAPESTLKSENIREIKKGGTFYTLKCLKTVRRSEYGDHCLSQHTQSIDQMNEMILRCPNWTRGCQFSTHRVRPKTGKLKFHPTTATLSHQPVPDAQFVQDDGSPSNRTLDNLPLWCYELLAMYLPSSSLYNLSLTSRKLREVVFIGCNKRCYIESVWHPLKKGSWIQKDFVWKISSTEPPPALEWAVPVDLSHHISQCSYFDGVVYEEKLIPVFPRNLENDIWNGFTNELSEKSIRAEIQDILDE